MKFYNQLFDALKPNNCTEKEWREMNSTIFRFYLDKMSQYINYWDREGKKLAGISYFQNFYKSWYKITILLKWSLTIFNPLKKFSTTNERTTLIQAIIRQLRDYLRDNADKLRPILLDQLRKGMHRCYSREGRGSD